MNDIELLKGFLAGSNDLSDKELARITDNFNYLCRYEDNWIWHGFSSPAEMYKANPEFFKLLDEMDDLITRAREMKKTIEENIEIAKQMEILNNPS